MATAARRRSPRCWTGCASRWWPSGPDAGRGWPARRDAPRFGLRLGEGAPAWTPAPWADDRPVEFGVAAVHLAGGAGEARLPAASFAWPVRLADGSPDCRVEGAGLVVTRPPGSPVVLLAELELRWLDCRFPADLCARWAGRTGDPVACLTVGARVG
jgi:hypothetical protein